MFLLIFKAEKHCSMRFCVILTKATQHMLLKYLGRELFSLFLLLFSLLYNSRCFKVFLVTFTKRQLSLLLRLLLSTISTAQHISYIFYSFIECVVVDVVGCSLLSLCCGLFHSCWIYLFVLCCSLSLSFSILSILSILSVSWHAIQYRIS